MSFYTKEITVLPSLVHLANSYQTSSPLLVVSTLFEFPAKLKSQFTRKWLVVAKIFQNGKWIFLSYHILKILRWMRKSCVVVRGWLGSRILRFRIWFLGTNLFTVSIGPAKILLFVTVTRVRFYDSKDFTFYTKNWQFLHRNGYLPLLSIWFFSGKKIGNLLKLCIFGEIFTIFC